MKSRKGQVTIGQLAGLAVTFVIVAIVVGFGSTILGDMRTSQCTGFLNTSRGDFCQVSATDPAGAETVAFNISNKGIDSLTKFGDNLPTLALVVVAAVIIGVLSTAFIMSR